MVAVRIEYTEERAFYIAFGEYTKVSDMEGERTVWQETHPRVPIENLEITVVKTKEEDAADERIIHEIVVKSLAVLTIDMQSLEIIKVDG